MLASAEVPKMNALDASCPGNAKFHLNDLQKRILQGILAVSERREIIENIEIPWQKTVIKELRGICALAFPIVPLVEG